MIDVNLIVLVGFCLFMFLALKYGYKSSIQALDSKIESVRKTLSEAEEKHDHAVQLLKNEQKKQKDLIKHIDEATRKKDEELAQMRQLADQELEALLESRRQNAGLIFDKIRIETIHNVKKEVTDLTALALEKIAQDYLTPQQHEHLNTCSIDQIEHYLGVGEEMAQKKNIKVGQARG
jgi:F0F1-type ATP synthase membrane subunit b/b'